MKTLIVIYFSILLMSAICSQAQTIEDRIQNLESHARKVDSAFGWTNPIIIDTTDLIAPTYEGIVMKNINADQFIFNPAFTESGIWNLYCLKDGRVYLATSPNGLNSFTYTLTNAGAGSILPLNGKYYDSYHKWWNALAYSYYSISLDKINFTDVAVSRIGSGEDRNVIYTGTEFFSYGRLQPRPRTIMFQRSSDFRTWTPPVEILRPDAVDGSLVQFYHMSVIRTAGGYFGLLNVYRIGNGGEDVQQLPPYATNEHTSDIQLVWSQNGIDGWQRLNDRKNFITRKPGVQQLFGWWSVIGDYAYIYTCESERKHTDWENLYNKVGKYYYSCRYKIKLTDLYLYH